MGQRLKPHQDKWFSDVVILLPAFLFVLSICVVRLKKLSMPMSDIYWSDATDTTVMTNVFTYWKAIVILAAGCLAVVMLIAGYFSDSIRFRGSPIYIAILVYLTFVGISLASSDYQYFAIRGMNEHTEGVFVLIAYMIMVIFLFNAVDSDRRLKLVIGCVLFASTVLGALGVTQQRGHDFLSTPLGQKLITPNETTESGLSTWEAIDFLDKFKETAYDFSKSVYQTVYNPNYVPLYLILVVAVTALLFIYLFKQPDKKKKLLAIPVLFCYGLFLFSFFASRAASGYVGLTVLFISAVIVFRRKLLKWILPLLCLAVVSGGVMYTLSDCWWPEIKATFFSVREQIVQFVYADDLPDIKLDYENAPASVFAPVDYIECIDGHLHFSVNGSVIDIARDEEHSGYAVLDADGDQLYMSKIENEDRTFEILDDRFHDYVKLSLQKTEAGVVYVVLTTNWNFDWPFRYDEEQFWYLNMVGKEVMLNKVEHAGLFDNYSFGSGRGRIYDTTLPMLKHYILKGAGPDCFAFVFPQNDYATRYSKQHGHLTTQVTDKAHNIYMQYWVNTGLPSLLAWLALIGIYLVGAVKSFRKRGFETFADHINGGIFCGILAFLGTAMLSDGSVNTMPMFYTMLGTGLALNRQKKRSAPKTEAKHEASMPEV